MSVYLSDLIHTPIYFSAEEQNWFLGIPDTCHPRRLSVCPPHCLTAAIAISDRRLTPSSLTNRPDSFIPTSGRPRRLSACPPHCLTAAIAAVYTYIRPSSTSVRLSTSLSHCSHWYFRSPPHPFITLLTNRPDSWVYLHQAVLDVCPSVQLTVSLQPLIFQIAASPVHNVADQQIGFLGIPTSGRPRRVSVCPPHCLTAAIDISDRRLTPSSLTNRPDSWVYLHQAVLDVCLSHCSHWYFRSPPHPFITLLTNRPDSWVYLHQAVLDVCLSVHLTVSLQPLIFQIATSPGHYVADQQTYSWVYLHQAVLDVCLSVHLTVSQQPLLFQIAASSVHHIADQQTGLLGIPTASSPWCLSVRSSEVHALVQLNKEIHTARVP